MNEEPMTMDIAPAAGGAIVKAEPTLMDILHEAVTRGADVGVIERLVALKERVDRNEAEKAFYEAKARLHEKLPQIEKSGAIVVGNTVRSRYALYEDIDVVLRPLLAEEGLSVEFDAPKLEGGQLHMTCTLAHRQGHREIKTLTLPLDNSGSKNPVQAVGSTVSFGKRYLLGMHINLVTKDEDDDGGGGKNTGEPLTQEQRDDIELLVKETKTDQAKLFAWIGTQSGTVPKTIAEIKQGDFPRVMAALRKRAAGL